jgi:hypothetical protein
LLFDFSFLFLTASLTDINFFHLKTPETKAISDPNTPKQEAIAIKQSAIDMAQKNDPSAALNANTIHTHIHSNILLSFL